MASTLNVILASASFRGKQIFMTLKDDEREGKKVKKKSQIKSTTNEKEKSLQHFYALMQQHTTLSHGEA